MYAAGATPDTVGWPGNAVAFVPWSPAAIPATCVACSEFTGSKGRFAYFHFGFAGANARATITFAVVNEVFPFGKPAGIVYPVGSKNGWVWSTPSSMIPIFMPWPAVASVGPQSAGAPISWGVRSRVVWKIAVGQTFSTPAMRASVAILRG